MSKERIAAYLTEKANKHEISHTDLPKLTELIEGYLFYDFRLKNRFCADCKFFSQMSNQEPCLICYGKVNKPKFEPK